MNSHTSWDDFRLVSAIADSRSLVGAAERLGINHSIVFRRLGALEKSLGVRLFDRARGGYTPTVAGAEMVAPAMRISDNISNFERRVAGRDVRPAGVLRITTNDTFVTFLLAPVFASFREAYPEIVLDVIVTHQPLNLTKRDADIAVRATREPPETLVGRRIATFAWCRYAPRGWTENGRSVDLEKDRWVGYGDALTTLPARKWMDSEIDKDRIASRFDTLLGVAHAIDSGLGIGAIPCFIGDFMPNLARVGEPMVFGDTLWLLTHEDLRTSARVRAFMDHAAVELGKKKAVIEGRRDKTQTAPELALS